MGGDGNSGQAARVLGPGDCVSVPTRITRQALETRARWQFVQRFAAVEDTIWLRFGRMLHVGRLVGSMMKGYRREPNTPLAGSAGVLVASVGRPLETLGLSSSTLTSLCFLSSHTSTIAGLLVNLIINLAGF